MTLSELLRKRFPDALLPGERASSGPRLWVLVDRSLEVVDQGDSLFCFGNRLGITDKLQRRFEDCLAESARLQEALGDLSSRLAERFAGAE